MEQPSQRVCFNVYLKTEYKQKQESAYTNAPEEVSSLDAST